MNNSQPNTINSNQVVRSITSHHFENGVLFFVVQKRHFTLHYHRSIASRLATRSSVRSIASQGFYSCHYEHSSPSCAQTKFHFVNPCSGFTLIEMMIAVMIVAILAAIAIPSYSEYLRRADLSTAHQEMQKIAALLERHRARNFSYDGFVLKGTASNKGEYFTVPNATNTTLLLPLNAVSGEQKFSLTLNVNSQAWSLKAESTNPRNYSSLLTSTGLKCKTKTTANITNQSCGTDAESW